MKDLIIFGAGGMARELVNVVNCLNSKKTTYNILGFCVDDSWYKPDCMLMGLRVYNREWLIKHKDDVWCVCALGYPSPRKEVIEQLRSVNVRFTSIIHPEAYVPEDCDVGEGCIVQYRCCVSVGCKLGDGVFLNTDVIIGHDVTLNNYVTCFPRVQISGNVVVDKEASIGSMSFINEKVKIGEKAVIAPGSIVFSNVKKNAYVLGNPAKRVFL